MRFILLCLAVSVWLPLTVAAQTHNPFGDFDKIDNSPIIPPDPEELKYLITPSAQSEPAILPAKPKLPELPPLKGLVPRPVVWEYEVADSGYRFEVSPETEAALIAALEKVVVSLCMPQVQFTFEHTGTPTDKNCLAYLEFLESLQQNNPVGTCARHGIFSRECIDVYRAQQVLPYHIGSSAKSESELDLDLAFRLAEANARAKGEKYEGLFNEAYTKLTELQKDKQADPEAREKARQEVVNNLALLIRVHCKVSRSISGDDAKAIAERGFKVSPTKRGRGGRRGGRSSRVRERGRGVTPSTLLPDEQEDQHDPLGELVEKLGVSIDAKEDIKEEPVEVNRIRFLSPDCVQLIARGEDLEPNLPEVHCSREGEYSPACVKAKRMFREKLKAMQIGRFQPTPTQALSSF